MTRDTACLSEIVSIGFHPQEVSLVSFPLHLNSCTRKQLYRRLQNAYAHGSLKLVKRLHALLALAQELSVREVAEMLALGEQTVRAYRNAFLVKGVASLVSQRPSGRPSKLTKTQRQELADLIKASPQAADYTAGCWNTPMIQDLIERRFGVTYHPHYIATLLGNLGFAYQKARCVSAHLNEAKRVAWRQREWPQILQQARQRKALLLFGDEASCAQWGSLSYTWAPKGQQPAVSTSGKRKGYKVFGLIDYFSASIKQAPLPSGSPGWDTFMQMTWEHIEEGARANRPGFKVVRKLLTDKRFNK
jgi:transposase